MPPLVSVIIPVYNRQELIKDALNSLIAQTYKHWEALVIDDGSSDNTPQIVKQFTAQEDRIKFFQRQQKPKGASTCRNIGIEKASGEFIIFLDSDDMLKPFALEQRVKTASDYPEFDFLVFQTLRFDGKTSKNWNEANTKPDLYRFLSLDSVWHTTGPMWKSNVVKKYLKFDTKLLLWQDVDFHLQGLIKGLKYKTFFNLPADVLYREHPAETISQRGYNKEQRKSQIYFIKKYYKLLKHDLRAKQILAEKTKILLKKNFQSHYFDNYIKLALFAITKGLL